MKKTMIIAMMMTMRLIIGKRDGEKAEGGWERVGKEEKGLGDGGRGGGGKGADNGELISEWIA